jgi:hypothetical protein
VLAEVLFPLVEVQHFGEELLLLFYPGDQGWSGVRLVVEVVQGGLDYGAEGLGEKGV